jgi:methyl-accepting chemotaxis protein
MSISGTDLANTTATLAKAKQQIARCGDLVALSVLTLACDALVRSVDQYGDLLSQSSPEASAAIRRVYRELNTAIEQLNQLTRETA